MKTRIFTMAAALFALISCQKDEVVVTNSNFPADGVIRINTNVNQTRAGMATSNLTDFWIHIDNPSNSTYDYVAYMKKEGDVWSSYTDQSATTPLVMKWQNSTTPITVYAAKRGDMVFAFDSSNSASHTMQADQSLESNLESEDLLYAKITVNPATDLNEDGAFDLALSHMLSKMVLTINISEELATQTISSVEIANLADTYIFNPFASTLLRATTAQEAPIKPFNTEFVASSVTADGVATYEMLLPPGLYEYAEGNNLMITIVTSKAQYEWIANKDVRLESGSSHSLTLQLGKDVVQTGSMTNTPWEDGLGGSLETE